MIDRQNKKTLVKKETPPWAQVRESLYIYYQIILDAGLYNTCSPRSKSLSLNIE